MTTLFPQVLSSRSQLYFRYIMVKILDGLYGIDHSEAKNHSMESWILDCNEGTILIDGGMTPEHVKGIGKELESIGKSWKDVDLILITHKHGALVVAQLLGDLEYRSIRIDNA